jgi:hypothetical protein
MEERIARTIQNIRTLEDLAQSEVNARARNALSDEVNAAIRAHSGKLGRQLIVNRTGLDLSDLSPAEEKILQAVSVYAGVMKLEGSNANRALGQIEQHGLLGAAERAVAKSRPTMGFQTLADADHSEPTYEQIIVNQFTRRESPSMRRMGATWRRDFRFKVPVRDLPFWQRAAVRDSLAETLGFLSDDDILANTDLVGVGKVLHACRDVHSLPEVI